MMPLVPHLTSTHPPAAGMMLRIPFLFLFPELVTSDKRYWVISAKRRSLNLRVSGAPG
jgi:hypothetical protein